MGAESSQEKQYSIDLTIDKQQYAIKDQIKGYITYYANPFYIKIIMNLLRIIIQNQDQKQQFCCMKQFIGYNEQSAWESISQDQFMFIYKNDLIRNCIYGNERKINEKVSFTYDLDLITPSGYESSYFKINYSLRATMQSKNQIIEKKEINFLIYRPFVDIERPIQKDNEFTVKSLICCNYGQIYVKVSLNKTDFLINDVANVLIECDQSLSTKNISNFEIDLLSKSFYSDEIIYPQIYNTIYSQFETDQKFQFIQKFPITSNRSSSSINQSLDCPSFTQQYFIQITCNTGLLTNSITFQLPIILYKTYEQNLNDERNNIAIHEPFNQDCYEEFKKIKFINFNIKQDKWNGQRIDFYDNKQLAQSQPEEFTNLIIIQQQQ